MHKNLLLFVLIFSWNYVFSQGQSIICNNYKDSSEFRLIIWRQKVVGCVGENQQALSVIILNDTTFLRLSYLNKEEQVVRKVIKRNVINDLVLFEIECSKIRCVDSFIFLRFSSSDGWRIYPICEDQFSLLNDFIERLE